MTIRYNRSGEMRRKQDREAGKMGGMAGWSGGSLSQEPFTRWAAGAIEEG
jgi:hypothetical protein